MVELNYTGSRDGLYNALKYWSKLAKRGEIVDIASTIDAKLEFEHKWAMPLFWAGFYAAYGRG